MTREQRSVIETLACQHGTVAVDEGYTDGVIRATTPDAREVTISEDGVTRAAGLNFAVVWEAPS